MINFEAFFKMSYGLYLVAAGDKEKGNGFVANSVFQVTAEPPQIAVVCNKNNYTFGLLKSSENFSVSVLSQAVKPETLSKYGYSSGKDISKFDNSNVLYGQSGVPIVVDEAVAYFECKKVTSFDVGTHELFIGEIVACGVLDNVTEPITYDYYHKVRKALAPKNAPTYIDKSKLKEEIKPATEVANQEVKKPETAINIEVTQESKELATIAAEAQLLDEINSFESYKCEICGYVYNPEEGDAPSGIAAGTKFEDLPDDWTCPICGAGKEEFTIID